jgi:hypothetical protein
MPFPLSSQIIQVLDVSHLDYARCVCAAALQGLMNRNGPVLFLDYGIYDDPAARRTNEVFLDDEYWFGKYREMLGNQDQRNLEYYQKSHGALVRQVNSLDDLIQEYTGMIKGCVLWDSALPDTANLALMLSSQEQLLPVEAGLVSWAEQFGLPVVHDLRGCWKNRIELYTWAFDHLFSKCKAGWVACVEPGWLRPEFIDFIVQNQIFTYSLSSLAKGFGHTSLLLLAFGPARLRELVFSLRLDNFLRRLGLAWMGWQSAEVRLATRIQRAVKPAPYPTIFGWHTCRDDELSFMLHLSANGLRLVPAHMASNMSFHSQVSPLDQKPLDQKNKSEFLPVPDLDPQGIYLTFTLSDGDQLMMMSTGELGNWYSPQRGSLPFNWETQPLLIELAPALLEKFTRSATPNDCLIAGPSGAGYIVPPLTPDLPAYLRHTHRVCQQAGIRVVTSYVGDPPARVLRELSQASQGSLNYLCGYAVLDRAPQALIDDTVIIANRWPTVAHLWDSAEKILEGVRKLTEAPGTMPCFISVHLFAYRTAYNDVVEFARSLKNEHIHIVRADTFLNAARQHLSRKSEKVS